MLPPLTPNFGRNWSIFCPHFTLPSCSNSNTKSWYYRRRKKKNQITRLIITTNIKEKMNRMKSCKKVQQLHIQISFFLPPLCYVTNDYNDSIFCSAVGQIKVNHQFFTSIGVNHLCCEIKFNISSSSSVSPTVTLIKRGSFWIEKDTAMPHSSFCTTTPWGKLSAQDFFHS